MTNNEHEGMKKCSKCGEWKPATAEFFHRDKTGACGLCSMCKECVSDQGRKYRQKNRDKILERKREYYEKNKEKHAEWQREYREKNKEKIADSGREYYEKNKEKIAEQKREYCEKNKRKISEQVRRYGLSPAGRLSEALAYIRKKTGATICLRDMTDEEKETLANQYVAVRTLEKTEKEMLAASGKKRCTKCDRILDYDCFHKKNNEYAGLKSYCKGCNLKMARKYREKNKEKIKEYQRKYRQQKVKKALDKIESVPDNRE